MAGSGSVAVGIFLPVGAVTEDKDQLGLSHLLEHLIFKGTKKRTAKDIAIEIDGTGGDMNAYTSVEYTSFYAKVLKEDMDLVLDMLFDITYHSLLEEEAVKLESGVVLSEIAEFYDAPDEICTTMVFEAAWGDHPLARQVLGTTDVIKNVTRDQVVKYHKKNYRIEDSVLAVCGDVTFEEIAEKLDKMGIKAQPLDGVGMIAETAPVFSPRKKAMDRDSEQVYFTYSWPGPTLEAKEVAEALVLSVIMSGSISSRLFQRLREREGLVYNIAMLSSFSKAGGLLGVFGATPKQNFKKSRELLEHEIELLRKDGATKDELERAKRMIKGSTTLSLESNLARMDRLGKLGLLLGNVPPIEEVLDRVMHLRLDRFNSYITKSIPEDFAIALVGKGVCKQEGFECE